eukprot:265878_1
MKALGEIMTVGLPIFQSQNQHVQSIDQSNVHHLDAMELAEKHHYVQMEHDREISRREEMRDILTHKSNKSQTLMINTTLMFGGGFAILIEGTPPENSPTAILILFSIFLGLSFFCLFLSLWFSMTLQSLMVKYNIHSPNQFYKCRAGIQQHSTFSDYYECHCVKLSQHAVRFFYIGTCSLMVTAALLFYTRFNILLETPTASYIFSIIIGITIVLIIVLKCCVSTNIRVSLQERNMYLNG